MLKRQKNRVTLSTDVAYEVNEITAGHSRTISSPEVWFIQGDPKARRTSVVLLNDYGSRASLRNPRKKIRAGCLLLLSNINIKVFSGDLFFLKLKTEGLAKILAFVDESLQVDTYSTEPGHWESIPDFNEAVLYDNRTLVNWFLQQIISGNEEYSPLLPLIRYSESYNFVRFLLKYSHGNKSQSYLGEKYGVSCSHFRRLCHQALGQSGKKEMCNWRVARTMLDIIDGKSGFTEAALHYGYSSSSHFSNEVKNKFGMSPGTLHKYVHNLITKGGRKDE